MKIVLFSILNIKDVKKGYNYIVEIARKLIDEDIFFVGVGNSDIKITKNLGSVGFISEEKSLVEIYNLADVFLYTSLIETMPLTVMESMSCGLPIVAFDVFGVQELVDNNCGILVDFKASSSLTENLKLLISNEELRKKMSLEAREKAVNYLSLNKTMTEYKKIYNDILNK